LLEFSQASFRPQSLFGAAVKFEVAIAGAEADRRRVHLNMRIR